MRFRPMIPGVDDDEDRDEGREHDHREGDPVHADGEVRVDRTDPRCVWCRAELIDRKSTRLNSSHIPLSRMPSSA